MKVENFSDEKVREMAENVRLNKITIPQSSFDAMKARCALFDELVKALMLLDCESRNSVEIDSWPELQAALRVSGKVLAKAEKL